VKTPEKQHSLARVLPLYAAAYVVLLCSLGAYAATASDDQFGVRAVCLVLGGCGVSLFSRRAHLSQNAVFGVLATVVLMAVLWVSLEGGSPIAELASAAGADRTAGPGTLLAWFVIVYSYAMLADEVIVFSVVPSIALLGLMASENVNPEIVVYFMGLVISAVFLLIYDNMLSKAPDTEDGDPPETRPETEAGFRGRVRAPLLLTVTVLGLALALGVVATLPLRLVGGALSDQTAQVSVPESTQFNQEVSNRYVNQLDLSGAPPHLTDRVVMQIGCETPQYWRGKVFDQYDGSSWSAAATSVPLQQDIDGFWHVKELRGDPQSGEVRGRQTVHQDVQLLDPPIEGMLVSASEPQVVTADAMLNQDSHRCISATDARAVSRYTVDSYVSVATPEQLNAAAGTVPFGLQTANTSVNDDGHEARLAIAKRVTAGARTEYEKVAALESYLRDNFEYSLTPPRTPVSQDAVTFFLTESKVGYCEAFASALAVLCREIGIPARLATGFAPGTPRSLPHRSEPVWVVRERDMHAWTEVYFPGYGWIPFDATSSRVAHVAWLTVLREFFLSLVNGFDPRNAGPLLVVLLMAGIGLSLAKWYVFDPICASAWWRTLLPRLHRRGVNPADRWDMLYARLHRMMRKHVGPKLPYQTPFEYAEQAREHLNRGEAEAFEALTRKYVQGAFQRGGPSEADFAPFQKETTSLRRRLRKNTPDHA
jgi:hypothetical protein